MSQSRRVAAWVVVGLTGSVVEFALLRVLFETLQWPFPIATAVAAEIMIVLKFVVADRWVFGHPSPSLGRLGRYHGASVGALAVYWLVANALGDVVGLAYEAAFVIGTAAAFMWSLLTNFLWVWAQPAKRHNPLTEL